MARSSLRALLSPRRESSIAPRMRQWLRKKNSVASCVVDVGASSQTIRGEGGHASSRQRTHLGDLASGDSPYVGIDDLLHG